MKFLLFFLFEFILFSHLNRKAKHARSEGTPEYVQLRADAEEDWDADGNTMSMSEMMSFYHSLALHEDQIVLVETLEQLEDFYTNIGQVCECWILF